MSLQELHLRLQQDFNDMQFSLTAELMQQLNLARLLPETLQTDHLLFQSAELQTAADSLNVRGITMLFGNPIPLPTRAEFKPVEEKIILTLTFSLPSNWRFSQHFPPLASTVFDRLTLAEPTFVVTSQPTDMLKVGLNFQATLTLDETFSSLRSRLPQPTTTLLRGQLTQSDKQLDITLSAPLSDLTLTPIAIGQIKLEQPVLQLAFGIFAGEEQPTEQTYIEASWGIDAIPLPVALDFPEASGIWRLSFWGDTAVSLKDLPTFLRALGESELVNFLPSEIQALGGISLSDLRLAFTLTEQRWLGVEVEVRTTEKWEMIPDQLAIADLRLSFTLSYNESDQLLSGFGGAINGRFDVADTSIPVSITLGPDIWQVKAFPHRVSLPSLTHLAHLIGNTSLQAALPTGLDFTDKLSLSHLELGFNPRRKVLANTSLALQTGPKWELIPGILSLNKINATLNIVSPFVKTQRDISGFVSGIMEIGASEYFVSASFPGESEITVGIEEIRLSELTSSLLKELSLPSEVPNLVLSEVEFSVTPTVGDFSFTGQSTTTWELPIGINGLRISDLSLRVNRTTGAPDKKVLSGTIGGTVTIGLASFAVNYNFPGDFVLTGKIPSFKLSALIQDLCGGEVLRNTPIPPGLLDAELTDLAVSIAPQQKTFALAATSALGKTELQIKRLANGNWGFSFGFLPPANWALSKLDPSLAVLDKLKFANTALIVASSDDRSFALTTVKSPRQDVTLQRGLNLFATLDMVGTGVDQLLGIKTLVAYAAIGNNPRELALEARFGGDFPLAENVTFGNITFRLRPSPTDFAVTLLGDVNAKLGTSQLRFTGGLGIRAITTPPSFQANLQATMQGVWNEPFGARGIAVAHVGLDLGIAFPPLRPSVGVAGALQIGEFKGAAAVKFDTANPGKSMVAIAFNRLMLIDVFKTFCPPAIAAAIPQEIAKTVLDVGFENVNIHIVPQPTSIGELHFEQGISLQGTMFFWGLRAFGRLNIDQTRGILVEGEVDEINLGGIFKLTGAGGKPKASLQLDLRTGQKPSIDISGAVELLGIRSETQLRVSDKGFFFRHY